LLHDADLLPAGTVIAGRYRVGRRLGEGGMGSVYLVQHLKTDEELALKLLHSTVVKDAVALERFQREARTPARIGSDHVVRVIDADVAPELDGVPFLVMELLRGHDLDQVLERRGPLPPPDVVSYLRQVARALDKAHALGIVHRDLKPENLFLCMREDGTPFLKVLDFGIAKITGAAGDLARHGSVTSTGQIFGTPLYMSPEQAKAESAKISPQTDVWALGLIAHKLLTGRDVWTAETLTHLIAQIAYEPMPVPSQGGAPFGPGYDAWFARCCAREPEARYRTAGEAVAALASSLAVRDYAAPPSSDVPSTLVSGAFAPPPSVSSGDLSRASFAETAEIGSTTGGLRGTAGPLTRTAGGSPPPMRRGLVAAIAVVGVLAGVGVGLALVRDRGGAPASGGVTQPVTTSAPSSAPTARPEASVAVAPSGTPEVAPAPEPSGAATAEPRPRSTSAPAGQAATAPRTPVAPKPPTTSTPVAKPPAPAATDDPLAGRH
jgi:serine/threonine-protein kinase